jgi:hypothetical protein
MVDRQSKLQDAITAVHEDVPHRFQVSLTMSMDVRDDIRAIRDELKDAAGDQDVTTNDVMRLALLTASQYHAQATGEPINPGPLDEGQLRGLAGVIDSALNSDDAAAEGETE